LNQRVCRLQNFSGIDKLFVYYVIQSELRRIQSQTYAVTVKHISSSQIQEISIPLPPLELQEKMIREIVELNSLIKKAVDDIANFESKIEDKVSSIWGNQEMGK
jgi:restriction endonuclease S subunit